MAISWAAQVVTGNRVAILKQNHSAGCECEWLRLLFMADRMFTYAVGFESQQREVADTADAEYE